MDKKVKAKWVRALRSGRYKQARAYLQAAGGFCCLGVLCKTQRLDIEAAGNGVGSLLSEATLELLRLSPLRQHKLAAMNDGGKTFAEIADWLERH